MTWAGTENHGSLLAVLLAAASCGSEDGGARDVGITEGGGAPREGGCWTDKNGPTPCPAGQRCCSIKLEGGCDDSPGTCPAGYEKWIWCQEWDWCASVCNCAADCCYCPVANCSSPCCQDDEGSRMICESCERVACGFDAECDARFPCLVGAIELRACCNDDDCAGLAPICGRIGAVVGACVISDF